MVYIIPLPAAGTNASAPVLLPPVQTLLFDGFERADTSAPDLGTAPTGQTWNVGPGWRILGGVAECNAAAFQFATADTGAADCRITATMQPSNGSVTTGIVFRYIDENNYMMTGRQQAGSWTTCIWSFVAGTVTVLHEIDGAPVSGVSDWEVMVDGAEVSVTTSSGGLSATIPPELSDGTRIGFRATNRNGFEGVAAYSR